MVRVGAVAQLPSGAPGVTMAQSTFPKGGTTKVFSLLESGEARSKARGRVAARAREMCRTSTLIKFVAHALVRLQIGRAHV